MTHLTVVWSVVSNHSTDSIQQKCVSFSFLQQSLLKYVDTIYILIPHTISMKKRKISGCIFCKITQCFFDCIDLCLCCLTCLRLCSRYSSSLIWHSLTSRDIYKGKNVQSNETMIDRRSVKDTFLKDPSSNKDEWKMPHLHVLLIESILGVFVFFPVFLQRWLSFIQWPGVKLMSCEVFFMGRLQSSILIHL